MSQKNGTLKNELTEQRKGVLAGHYLSTPPERRAELLAAFKEHGAPEEAAFLEKIAADTH